jgi:hypothetical protein
VVNQTEIFPILMGDLERNDNECQLNTLGLLINLTNEKSNALEGSYKKVRGF